MISLQKLQQVMFESRDMGQISPVTRQNYLDWITKSISSPLIKAILGFRRSGKSFLLKMFTAQLQQTGIPAENIFYLNFENDLLSGIKTVTDLRIAWEMYVRDIAKSGHPIYVIWDEVQLVKNWERLVRTLYEQGKYQIFVSGSNSHLLSGELSSTLSGRSLSLEIKPFSFVEFLDYQQIPHSHYFENKLAIDQAFRTYLVRGGIAEQFSLDDTFLTNYKTGLIQKIILDDIVKRYAIDNVNVLQQTYEFVSGNITSTPSLRKIVNRLGEHGIQVPPTTIDNYISYWMSAYVIAKLPKFDYRLSRVFNRTNKYYLVDNLFIPGRIEADEKRLENLVYVELVRRYGTDCVYFGQDPNGYEIDFVVKLHDTFLYFQVCLTLTDDNAKREFGNLDLINKYLPGQSTVLYFDDQRKSHQSTKSNSVVEWLVKDQII